MFPTGSDTSVCVFLTAVYTLYTVHYKQQCCGFITFWYGSGFGSGHCYFVSLPSRRPQKIIFCQVIFCLLGIFWTFNKIIFFNDKKISRSYKTVGIKVFLTIFTRWQKDPESDPYLWLTDPDGPKTYGSYWSGTATLTKAFFNLGKNCHKTHNLLIQDQCIFSFYESAPVVH
jgi:hypothetical protein